MNILRLFSPRNAFLCQRFDFLHNSAAWRKLVQFNLSDIGEGIAEVQLKEWHVKVGDEVSEFDEICAVQSDKASVTITSRYSGTIKKLYFQTDDIAKVGQPLVDIEVADQQQTRDEQGRAEIKADTPSATIQSRGKMLQNQAPPSPQQQGKILASPAVRRLMREHRLDAGEIDGSGPNGRVLKEDILRRVQAPVRPSVQRRQTVPQRSTDEDATSSSSSSDGEEEADRIVPIRGYARAMIKTMTEALAIPHFGYGDEIVADELVRARDQLAPIAAKRGIRLSFMPFLIKATSLALREFPMLNASLDQNKENLIQKHSHNICFAMDTPDGLAVPSVKNCQRKNIWEIAVEMDALMKRGKQKQFSREDLAGGTFTLSNIGSIGGTFMNPVILPPQVAIGAIGRIRKVPHLEDEGDDEYEPTVSTQSVMNVFWAADHRVIDGATLARFSNRFKQLLESPAFMLVELR